MKTESTYRLTPGTTVVVKDEEGVYTRYTVEDGVEIDFILERVGCSHATMNGGGFDHYGRCPITGERMTVRTTLSRPAHQTFAPVAS